MSDFFDALETRSADERETAQFAALREQASHAIANTAYFGQSFAGVDPAALTDGTALAKLPLVRKADLIEHQAASPPYGGMNATAVGDLARLYVSPGPILDPEGRSNPHQGGDWWRFGRALHAAGFRAGDIVLNSFSYHLTPAGSMFEQGAHACGCAVIPGGVGNTEGQVQAAAAYRATGFAGTPDFPKLLFDKADELGVELSLKKLSVGAGPLFPSMRKDYQDRGLSVLQTYGTADLGSIAYESAAMEGMILDEHVLVEIVRPGTGDPVAEGEVGEVVVSLLSNRDYPLIRFATGDLSAMMPGHSPCGRTAPRIKGWMGRADQTTKVRGMFVRPQQVAEFVSRHPQISKARFVVGSDDKKFDTLAVKVETSGDLDLDAAAETVVGICKVRGTIEPVARDSLPNDGKVIDDTRSFD